MRGIELLRRGVALALLVGVDEEAFVPIVTDAAWVGGGVEAGGWYSRQISPPGHRRYKSGVD